MDKTMTVMVSATIIMVMGVIVVTMFAGGTDTFSSSAEDLDETGCEYQVEQAGPTGDTEDLSHRCEEQHEERVRALETATDSIPYMD